MKLANFNYTYPEELVAQRPLPRREDSRMMVIDRANKSFGHAFIKDLPKYLNRGDILVVNDSLVEPVRLIGKKDSGSRVELLLLKNTDAEKNRWEALSTRTKRLKEGDTIIFEGNATARVVKKTRVGVVVDIKSELPISKLLEKIGLPPLPPYIRRGGRESYTNDDRERYQTVYAKNPGSAAAPTAGFHLTGDILEDCNQRGIGIAYVTLHVGTDTFAPVRVSDVERHEMHGEEYSVPKETTDLIKGAKKNGGRVVAVGTTTVRALETCSKMPLGGTTNIFIYPGYEFKVVDVLLTNFHQPRSTLLMLVSAFAGREFVLQMYAEAIKERYRLFSYGDCMLVL